MYLKRIEIQGFKSFLDKCSLEFNSGITSIVGPNGSGKSNIADALRWVLGEQSAKTLRGSRMEDVIFAGTENRKPVGFSEVSVTFDNSCGTLPIEYNEVTIARRIFRSGESEYSINMTPCRLKDITELLLDTGIGKEGYSIIGQGRVEEIISSKSDDRRHIFEEASGIMKFKVRKQEAERKIEQTRHNLLRINDIISELGSQLTPLQEQADAAHKYLGLNNRLRDLEVNLFLDSIGKFRQRLTDLAAEYNTVKSQIEEEEAKLETISEESQRKAELQKQLESKFEEARQQFHDITGNIEKGFAEITINNERIINIEANIGRIGAEAKETESRIESLSKEQAGKAERLNYLSKKHDEYNIKLVSFEQEMADIISMLGDNERFIEEKKITLMERLDTISDKRVLIGNISTQLENIDKRKRHVAGELTELSLEIDRGNILVEELQVKTSKLREEVKVLISSINSSIYERKNSEAKLAELRRKENSVKTDLQVKNSRLSLLDEMERNMEGYNKSVRALIKAGQADHALSQGMHGTLSKLISVEKKFETAIETSLGNTLQDIVAETEEDAKRAIEYLKKNKLGRATFLPITSLKPRSFDRSAAGEISRMSGYCGIASELVTYDSHYSNIVLNLLGKVVIVEGIDNAIKMARKSNYGFKIVTTDGEVLSTSGSITGGSLENLALGFLGRAREITELKKDIVTLQISLDEITYEITGIVDSVNTLNKKITADEAIVRESDISKAREESRLAQALENSSKILARMEHMKNELAQLSAQEDETRGLLDFSIQEMKHMDTEITDLKSIIDGYQDKRKEDQTLKDSLHMDITDHKISVNSIIESMQAIEETISRITAEIDTSMKALSRKNMDKEKGVTEIRALKDKNEGISVTIRNYEEAKSGKVFEIDRMSEERNVISEELSETSVRLADINRNMLLLQEESGRIEVRKTRIEADLDSMISKLWDDYQLTIGTAQELKKEIGSASQAQRVINELRESIRELGSVNVHAIEQYSAVKERHDFLAVQKDDLEQSEIKLRKVIMEITASMKEKFIEQFKLINNNFSKVFKELFGGGRAELRLTDSDNLLESGIEIEIQPPGKKLQSMSLLSGGERALTAIALLFSILLLNPAPFCVLDEIDAMLDDANVYRFANYLKRFVSRTQFLVVTHRRGTIELSDAIYGVTMQEHGISRIVSMKLGEKAS